MIDIIGVMPEPAARQPSRRPIADVPVPAPNRPAGVITSTVSPAASSPFSQLENSPPLICLTPIRSRPCSASSAGVEQIE